MATRRPKPALEPKLTQLTSNFNENPVRVGSISPDNKYLAYADNQGVHLRNLATGESRNLNSPSTNHRIVQFNGLLWLDGVTLIGNDIPSYERQTEGTHARIWRIPVSGDPPRVIREDAEATAVSPDGKLILFNTHRGALGPREVWQMNSNGGQERLLLRTDENSAVYGLAWLANERLAYLLLDNSGTTVQSQPLSGGASTTALAFREQTTSGLQDIDVLPNGRTFYVLAEPGSNDLYCTLWETRIDPETGKLAAEPHKLTSRTRSCMKVLDASANGQRIIFQELTIDQSIYLADSGPNGSTIRKPRRITPNEAYRVSAWTRDSQQVIYVAYANGHPGIYRQTIVGGSAELVVSYQPPQLASGNGTSTLRFIRPRLTPDGKFLLYTANDEKSATRRTILRVPLAGGTPEEVLSADIYGRPDCALQPYALCAYSERSQDRTQVVFTSFDPFNGSGHRIATFIADTKADYRWAISPGANSIALVNTQTPTIDVVYLDEHPARKITVKGQRNFDWLFCAPDGKGFYVSTLGEERSLLLYVDLHGNAHSVWEEAGGLGTLGIPSPDGKHIALQSWTLATNLWSMENF
jgi:Tol biopolymer transport system component